MPPTPTVPTPTPTPPGQTPPGPNVDPRTKWPPPGATDAQARIREILAKYGLGTLADWAYEQILQGRTEAEVVLALYERPEFEARFPAIKLRRDAGLSPISPAEYIEYENRAHQLLRAAGLPPGFYDGVEDFTRFIARDVSIEELGARVDEGYRRMAQAPDSVKGMFNAYFGASGESALAAYFLDPDRAVPLLETQVAAATFGGVGLEFGAGITEERALRVAKTGVTQEQARRGFQELDQRRSLFTETIDEREDLTIQEEGVDNVFGLGGEGARKMQRRGEERVASTSGGGRAQTSEEGARGLGSSRAGT